MKTTIELPDALLREAKETALRRRTTLKSIIEHALRRELDQEKLGSTDGLCFEVDADGLPVFGNASNQTVTSEQVYQLMDELGI